ncbi:MAG TPA: hypothetical protein VIJ75_02375 [Hanamia sp.]
MNQFAKKTPLIIFCIFFAGPIIFNSCSKKSHPSSSTESSTEVKKEAPKTVVKTPKANFPKVISVNDSAANKSVDGRLYYDVMGHRYWKNYKDGKYYLFNKSMYSDPAFKNPG